jgi:hypothetical protein
MSPKRARWRVEAVRRKLVAMARNVDHLPLGNWLAGASTHPALACAPQNGERRSASGTFGLILRLAFSDCGAAPSVFRTMIGVGLDAAKASRSWLVYRLRCLSFWSDSHRPSDVDAGRRAHIIFPRHGSQAERLGEIIRDVLTNPLRNSRSAQPLSRRSCCRLTGSDGRRSLRGTTDPNQIEHGSTAGVDAIYRLKMCHGVLFAACSSSQRRRSGSR